VRRISEHVNQMIEDLRDFLLIFIAASTLALGGLVVYAKTSGYKAIRIIGVEFQLNLPPETRQ
jgi:hypothetical protein